jgi:hypothetical protein
VAPTNQNGKERSENEWEKCLESVHDFDTILIDLRKYGFTFISALLGSEVFFGLALGIQNAILLTIATLTVVIYWLDLYYRNALSGSLLRSIFLEMFRLDAGITYTVSSLYAKTKSEYYIVLLYAGLFITAVFIATAVNTTGQTKQLAANTTQLATNSKQLAADSKQLATKSTELAPSLTKLAANLTQIAGNLTNIATNSSKLVGNSTDLLSNVQINTQKISSKDLSEILVDLYDSLMQPFVLAIFIVGIGFILTMYLTSRKRQRTFSQMMKVYDYCYTLGYENGFSELHTDLQRIIIKILWEKERARYMFSLPLGKSVKKTYVQKSNSDPYTINKGKVGTLILAERKPKILRLSKDNPDHYWLLVSQIGILMLNTIGTFDRPRRPDVYHFALYGKKEDVKKKLQDKRISSEHSSIVSQIYNDYQSPTK